MNPWLRCAWPLKDTAPRVFQNLYYSYLYLSCISRIQNVDQVTNLSSSDEFELQKIYIYIYKGEKIFTVQSYLFNILTRNLSKHVGSTPGMNYCCTLAPMKRNIYAVLLDTSHCQNTIDGWHMGWRMLSRQCFHGKHTLASHYNTFRHQRFIVGERNGKCADYFYPRTGTDVCLTLVYL